MKRLPNGNPAVMIMTPTRASSTTCLYTVGILNSTGLFGAWVPLMGQSDLYVARNILLNEFLRQKSFDTLVCIDSDIGFARKDFERLLSHPHDIITGCYPGRTQQIASVIRVDGNRVASIEELTQDSPVEVTGIPMGFVKMSRRALEKMVAHGNLPTYGDPIKYQFFQSIILNNELASEDISFSVSAREAGLKLYADGHIRLNHDGYCFPPVESGIQRI